MAKPTKAEKLQVELDLIQAQLEMSYQKLGRAQNDYASMRRELTQERDKALAGERSYKAQIETLLETTRKLRERNMELAALYQAWKDKKDPL